MDEIRSTQYQQLALDMLHTMRVARGMGLAAPQVGVSKRLFVADVGKGSIVAFNPSIVDASDETEYTEGCLSLPGMIGEVTRCKRIVLRAIGIDGKPFKVRATAQRLIDEMLADCLQHEIDHLDGILYIDKVRNLRPTLPL